MGKRAPVRPAWTATIATLLANDVAVRAICERCEGGRDVDLLALAVIKGEDYNLWDRKTRCRITPGCTGWNRFYFNGRGRFEPMNGE